MNALENIIYRLTFNNPAPWTVEMHWEHQDHVYRVSDKNEDEVLLRETYTGDGDHVGLDDDQLLALVELVNTLSAP